MASGQFQASSADPEDHGISLAERAVHMAARLLEGSRRYETAAEKARSARMARMMADDAGKRFTIALADEVLRVSNPKRAAERLRSLLRRFGTPRYLSWLDRRTLEVGTTAASIMPSIVMPAVSERVRRDAEQVIVSAENGPLNSYLERRRREGIRVNLNQLGEAVLGDLEAAHRLKVALERLSDPRIDYISVKLSAIASQISLTGYRATIATLAERLRTLYRAAIQAHPQRPKFVNLDMEEYRDLHLTVDVFRKVLDEPEFEKLEAGIVLQAYLPDSFAMQKELTSWALARKARSGAGIKLRLVKGANLAMEQVEAALKGWPQAPYQSKLDVDANYKRMLRFACRPEHTAAVRIGVASHNLFDVAYALLLREAWGVADRVEFEMLEGMANAQALELRRLAGELVLYTPIVRRSEFESGVAYLVRRLDENTAAGSFLGDLFGLREGTEAWHAQCEAFLAACRRADDPDLSDQPQRRQNRLTEKPLVVEAGTPFANEPDTDFSLPANRQWTESLLARWRERGADIIAGRVVPLQVGGQIETRELLVNGRDPSRPADVPYRWSAGSSDDVQLALATAERARETWGKKSIAERAAVLRSVAATLAEGRADSIGCMILDGGKAISEGDVEVSEAIDFARYYAQSLDEARRHDGVVGEPLGTVVVAPPWNFPYAIPAGGCLAALMAGNSVILKPAPEAVLTAWRLVNQLWQAGVPQEVLQFLPLIDGDEGRTLITDPRVGAVILTGGYSTAELFQSWRPDLNLMAETSGKNALIITATADLDLAVKDLVRGAFGHAGQKCSATSLALVEAEVYDSPKFRQVLRDAAASLTVGEAWNPSAVVTPLIREPGAELERGLRRLDDGETWLLEPRPIDGNPCLWSPGIRWGVQRGSWYHRTECFGPVLGVMRVRDLEEAIEIQNSNDFGLTGGIHALDLDEIATWKARVEVGNAYINRGTTGAIVRRQPFGGWKRSSVGVGAKAGGPNYVASLMRWKRSGEPRYLTDPQPRITRLLEEAGQRLNLTSAEQTRLRASAASFAEAAAREFSLEHDPSQIHGETNRFRYRPRPWQWIRIADPTAPIPVDVLEAVLAGLTFNVETTLSSSAIPAWGSAFAAGSGTPLLVESEATFAERLERSRGGIVRWSGEVPALVRATANGAGVPVITDPATGNGLAEGCLLHREQAVSETVHRYGNLRDSER